MNTKNLEEIPSIPLELYHIINSLSAYAKHGDEDTTKLSNKCIMIINYFLKSAGVEVSPQGAKDLLEKSGIWSNSAPYSVELISEIEKLFKNEKNLRFDASE